MDPWSNTATDTGNYPYLSLSFSLSFFLSLSLSLSHSLIISSLNKNQYSLDSSITNTEIKPNKSPPDPASGSGGENHTRFSLTLKLL